MAPLTRSFLLLILAFLLVAPEGFGFFVARKNSPVSRSVACAYLMNDAGSSHYGWRVLSPEDAEVELEFFMTEFWEQEGEGDKTPQSLRRLEKLAREVRSGAREMVVYQSISYTWSASSGTLPALQNLGGQNDRANKLMMAGMSSVWHLGYLATLGTIALLASRWSLPVKLLGSVGLVTATSLVTKGRGLKFLIFKAETLPDLRSDFAGLYELRQKGVSGIAHHGGRGRIRRDDRAEFFRNAAADLKPPKVKPAWGALTRWYDTAVDYDWILELNSEDEAEPTVRETVFFSRRRP